MEKSGEYMHKENLSNQWNRLKISSALILSILMSLIAVYENYTGFAGPEPNILSSILLYLLPVAIFALWSKDVFISFIPGFGFYIWMYLWHSFTSFFHANLKFSEFIILGVLFGAFGISIDLTYNMIKKIVK